MALASLGIKRDRGVGIVFLNLYNVVMLLMKMFRVRFVS